MRVTLAQLNVTVGAFEQNFTKIGRTAAHAKAKGALVLAI